MTRITTSNDAREQRRVAIEGLRDALHTMGRALSSMQSIEAYDAYATAWQIVGRLEGIDEGEAFREACEAGKIARFPRPIIELADPDTFAGVEIDPLLTPVQVEGAFHQAVDETFERAWRDFECGENSDERIDAVNDALRRITGQERP